MKRNQYAGVLLAGLVFVLMLSGCSMRHDNLFALPKQSDVYYHLQDSIDQVMEPGAAYAGPVSGSNQQAVQMADLDGDGTDEALAFLRTADEHPLAAYVFERSGESFTVTAQLSGDGAGFDIVEYAQLDGEPGMEVIIGRRLNDQIARSMTVYTYKDRKMTALMNTTYSELKLVDLDEDDCKDVLVLRLETEEHTGTAELYSWQGDGLKCQQEAYLSTEAMQIRRVTTGRLEKNIPAVFVTSTCGEDSLITDVFAWYKGNFQNVTSGDAQLQASKNARIYVTDIDEDGITEIPIPQMLPDKTGADSGVYAVDWYSVNAKGILNFKQRTCHNVSEGWYLILPEDWSSKIAVSRTAEIPGVSAYTVSRQKKTEDIFTIYAFTGDDRLEQANTGGRFQLAEKGETVYAAVLGSGDWAASLTKDELSAMFHFIHEDWNPGET